MTNPPTFEQRCTDGAACVEVTARIEAADRIEYVEGDKPCADRLRETAARFAELHQHGTDNRTPQGVRGSTGGADR